MKAGAGKAQTSLSVISANASETEIAIQKSIIEGTPLNDGSTAPYPTSKLMTGYL